MDGVTEEGSVCCRIWLSRIVAALKADLSKQLRALCDHSNMHGLLVGVVKYELASLYYSAVSCGQYQAYSYV
jgi:hypothetical protein